LDVSLHKKKKFKIRDLKGSLAWSSNEMVADGVSPFSVFRRRLRQAGYRERRI